MVPARALPDRRDGARLLVVDPAVARLFEGAITDLPAHLAPGDLLVVNDAATLPASLAGCDDAGHPVEARLVDAPDEHGMARAVLFGAGDWRTRTEDRPAPPALAPGAQLHFDGLAARLVTLDPVSARLVGLRFDRTGAALWAALYRAGRPVQYSYLERELPLWAVQTVYAARPWAAEMPSAGRPLSWEILLDLRRRGVRVAALTHAAGLSATGDPALDAALPLRERFDLPAATVQAIADTRQRGRRIVAVGTTVVRALEGAAADGGLVKPGPGDTDLRIGPGFHPRVVDGVLSGVHGPDESHFALLSAFANASLLNAAWKRADELGFRSHELGDATLVLRLASRPRPS
jgi:S-adenosylmethionine:tRNA ribosyltransferase-isomerase